MAITLTIAELLAALRLTDTPEELAEATRLHALASEITTTTAPHAPAVVMNECVVRLSAFLYDMPNAAPGDSYANAWRASGAGRLALPYIIHRAGLVGGDAVEVAQNAVGTVGNPVIGVDVVGGELVVTFADGSTDTHTLPAGGGGDGTDQTARDAAAAAAGDVVTHNAAGDAHQDIRTAIDGRVNLAQVEETAQRLIDSAGHATNVDLGIAQDSIERNADALIAHEGTPHGGGGGGEFVLGNVSDGRLPLPPVTMRIAWIEMGDVINEATFGPLASVGDTNQTRAPAFPQLYLDAGLGSAVLVFWSATVGLEPAVYPLDSYEIVSGPGIPLTVESEDGTWWKSDVNFSRHAADDRFSLQFPGLLIASQVWVEEQIDAIPGGGGEGVPALPTPPVTLVDGELYTAYGDVTIPGWRGYDFVQFLYTTTGNTYQTEAVNTVQLIALSPITVAVGRNVGWTLTIRASDTNVITIATIGGNTVPVPDATSTMTVIAWFAGTVVQGEGGGTVDQTARDAAAAAQVVADANTVAATAHAGEANAHHIPPEGGGGSFPAFHQVLQSSNAALTSTDAVLPGMTLPASNFNEGEQWRFTVVVAMTGIGTDAHDVRVSLNQGGNAYVNTEIRQDDETSPTKFNAIIDYVLTIPSTAGDVDVRARESVGNILTQSGSSMIAVRMG